MRTGDGGDLQRLPVHPRAGATAQTTPMAGHAMVGRVLCLLTAALSAGRSPHQCHHTPGPTEGPVSRLYSLLVSTCELQSPASHPRARQRAGRASGAVAGDLASNCRNGSGLGRPARLLLPPLAGGPEGAGRRPHRFPRRDRLCKIALLRPRILPRPGQAGIMHLMSSADHGMAGPGRPSSAESDRQTDK